ncbi:MAG: restriction endonuclease, partial [bacterium]
MEPLPGKGRLLEERIATFLAGNGYSTKQNVFLEGRSGGRHEIDVLAEKDDGITTFRLAVECKAWNTPIEKDVVSKLAYVMTDLGLNKGIVVSLKGF